ncbi:hypothetical protein [Oryza sativa Japonica Group]|uniref:Uncharacterized protein n=1 Tax=Oryza sativa subsp. japonica TaxID=39947 RepID=Q9ARN5_ORYSJ|nr:hypothetical protein [Oryza sativa Japonica Group]
MGIVTEDVDIDRVSVSQLGRNSKHINDAVFQTPSAQHLPQAIPTRSWPRTGGAARGWPEKTNPGDGDRKSVDERDLGAASPPHRLLPQPQPPQVRKKRDSTVEIGKVPLAGGGELAELFRRIAATASCCIPRRDNEEEEEATNHVSVLEIGPPAIEKGARGGRDCRTGKWKGRGERDGGIILVL